jgi:hypothetical protein
MFLRTNKTIDTVYSKLPGFIKEIDNYKSFKKQYKQFLPLHTFHSLSQFSLLSFPAVQHNTLNHNTPTHRPLNQSYMINHHIDLYFHVTKTDPEAP